MPIEYDYDILDIKHIIQAQLGFDPEVRPRPRTVSYPHRPFLMVSQDINIRAAGDFRPDEAKLGPIFGRWFKEGWHMQASVYPKGWKSALEKWREENASK